MSDLNKKCFIENEKGSYNNKNLNSFRGPLSHNNIDKSKNEKENKLFTARVNALQSTIEKTEKETDQKGKNSIKPRLLTGKLPSAFDVKYKRNGIDQTSFNECYSPTKLIDTKSNYKMCGTEEDVQYVQPNHKPNKQNLLSGILLSDSDSNNERIKIIPYKINTIQFQNDQDQEKDKFTRPILVKNSSARLKSSHPQEKKVHNNFLLNIQSNVNSDTKSTGNNSQASSNHHESKTHNSRTHDSFFPKMKNSFEIEKFEVGDDNKNKNFNTNNGVMKTKGNNIIQEKINEKFENSVKLEDGISLSLIKITSDKRTKKFFHLPNFEIYSIKEIQLNSKIFISNFREKVFNWKKRIGTSYKFIKIFSEYINNPEGYISLVIEYMQGYTLQDMIENVGWLNESVLCKIAIQIIQCLQEYHDKFKEDYGEFCTCNILFDKNGNLKMMPNFLNQMHKTASRDEIIDNHYGITAKCKCYDYFHNNHPLDSNMKLDRQLFDLGYVIFISAIGGMKFDSFDYLLENLWNKTNTIKLKCCLLHTLISLEDSLFKNCKLKISQVISNKTFSENFIDFLCQAMRFNTNFDNTITTSLFNHSWVNVSNYIKLNNNFNRVRVSTKEFIKLSREYKKNNQHSHNEKKFLNFLNNFDIILSNNKCIKRDELIQSVNTKKGVIKELSTELGINSNEFVQKLLSNIYKLDQ